MATLGNLAVGGATPRLPTTVYAPGTRGAAGDLSSTGGVAMLGDNPNLSTIDQYNTLLRSDSPLLAFARGNAMDYANAMGAGVDSASYGYNAERGMAAQLQPLVQQDAQTQLALQQGNQDAMNRMALAEEASRGQAGAAQISAASQMAQLRYQAQIDQQNRAQNREWEVADQGTQARASARSQFFGNMENAMFSDPSFWRDPQGVMGAFNEYGSNFDEMFNSMFPEYAQNISDAGQPT